jgi:alkylation response protein AidB-like acyl-CoA dehydrogenase
LDFGFGAREVALRQHLRDLIADRLPPDFLGAFTDDPDDFAATQEFCKDLGAENLLTLAWPSEYGGADGSLWEQTVVREEMWAHHEPRGPQYMGLNWIGPAIMQFGTDAQKAEHLPRIAAGDVTWCQGFSEPDAGSDLAALQTRAVRDGDTWRINGQKIWTSYAQLADWCVLAARTSVEENRHRGISLFLLPMDRPGISVRPVRSMVGPHHLNDVFFDDVWGSSDEILGGTGEGWAVMRAALRNERVGIARYARCDRLLSLARQTWADEWASLPLTLRLRWARAMVTTRVARLLAYRVVAQMEQGTVRDEDASIARVATTLCDQESAEALLPLAGAAALVADGSTASLAERIEDHWRYAQASTVAAGTVEMQRMLIARALKSAVA